MYNRNWNKRPNSHYALQLLTLKAALTGIPQIAFTFLKEWRSWTILQLLQQRPIFFLLPPHMCFHNYLANMISVSGQKGQHGHGGPKGQFQCSIQWLPQPLLFWIPFSSPVSPPFPHAATQLTLCSPNKPFHFSFCHFLTFQTHFDTNSAMILLLGDLLYEAKTCSYWSEWVSVCSSYYPLCENSTSLPGVG